MKNRNASTFAPAFLIGLLAVASGAEGQYCPVASTYFTNNYSRPGCTIGTCWASAPFPGSTAISGSQYPSTNYACAATAPAIGALENTFYTYDSNGNLTVAKDPLGRSTTNTYDALSRLTQVLDPASGTTRYAYNGNGVLKQVTDPRNLITSYTLNGFGETTTLASPDTGNATSTYDLAGNLLTRVDARGVTATYTYDALNRVTQVVYSKSGSPSETHTFTYDVGANAKGRLTQVTDPAGSTSWTYEAHGRVTGKTQVAAGVTKTTGYAYNAAGQLATLTTPSGQRLTYTYSNNRIANISVNGTPLITGATTEPFGPLNFWHWGNGLYSFRDYDTDGRLASWEFRDGVSILRSDLTWDTASRITAVNDPTTAAIKSAYQYDALDRLTVSQKGNPVTSTQQFGYDAVGNRSNKTVDGQLTNYTYLTTNNRLQALTGVGAKSYTYDAAGNPTVIGTRSLTYNLANRLVSAAGATYAVNALGQRLTKSASGVTSVFVYDEQGHVIGEYDGSGTLVQETVWLEDLPIATLRPTGSGNPPPIAIYYVHPDHLGSPRAITRPSDNVFLWRWDNIDPFGTNVPNENPAGQGLFKYALRFPGQYYDAETQTHYNYFRDYDPPIGRYEQSDPIGLRGGINTYVYVADSPVSRVDRTGLDWGARPICGIFGCTFPGDPDYPISPGYPWPTSPNGNVAPGFSMQDGVCSPPFSGLNSNRCALKCCQEHDSCFATYGCNKSSWLGSPNSPCGICNRDAAKCIAKAKLTCPDPPCGKSNDAPEPPPRY